MASTLTPAGLALKFVIVPVALVAAGYFVIAPRIGGVTAPAPAPTGATAPAVDVATDGAANDEPKVPTRATTRRAADATPADVASAGAPIAPQIDVSVQPDDGTQPAVSVDTPVRRRHKRPTAKTKPATAVAPKSDNPADEGSVGGTKTGDTAGGTTGGDAGSTDGGGAGTTGIAV